MKLRPPLSLPQELAATSTRLELIREEIENAEDLFRFCLDAARNRLITVDAILTLLGTAIACAAAVGGFYGMNLRNPQADDRGGFAEVTLFTVAGCLAFLDLTCTILGNFTCAGLGFNDDTGITRHRSAIQTEDFDGLSRQCHFQGFATII